MTRLQLAATALLLGGIAAPAFAGEGGAISEGYVSVFTNGGPMYEGSITDTALLDEIARTGIELPAGTMVAVHNGKAYLVKDSRMASGKMMSDMVHH